MAPWGEGAVAAVAGGGGSGRGSSSPNLCGGRVEMLKGENYEVNEERLTEGLPRKRPRIPDNTLKAPEAM